MYARPSSNVGFVVALQIEQWRALADKLRIYTSAEATSHVNDEEVLLHKYVEEGKNYTV